VTIFPTGSSEIQSDEWKYAGIGGWLIFVTIGLCLSPLFQIVFVATKLVPIFFNGAWRLLTTQGTAAYHPLWAPVLIFELFMNLGFIGVEAILLVLLFRHSRLFPQGMIAYYFIVFALTGIDHFAANLIPAVAKMNDAGSLNTFIRAGVLCAIWVPYFLRSKRVKGTFTG